jgi:hypothetical protein
LVELKEMIQEKDGFYSDDLVVEYLHEISKGCFGLASAIMDKAPSLSSCDGVMDSVKILSSEQTFLEDLRFSLNQLSASQKNLVVRLMKGQILEWEADNPDLEPIFLSGLINRAQVAKKEVIEIRSWAHEVTLRKNAAEFFPGAPIYRNPDELIPPSSALNKMAYGLALEIENLLRNFVIISLAESASENHPLELLDVLGKVKSANLGGVEKCFTFSEFVTTQRNKYNDRLQLDTHASLSSYLTISDLIQILTERVEGVARTGLETFDKRVDEAFPDKKPLKDSLSRFKDLRNPIAHNNLIGESVVKELEGLRRQLLRSLMAQPGTTSSQSP